MSSFPSHNQIVMGGRGFYNAHSQLQHSAIRYGLPFLHHALKSVPLPATGHPFLIADFGSSEGRNSLEVMRVVVEALRRRTSGAEPIVVVHIDQPGNDFSSLFTLLQSSPDSYLRRTPNVFAYAAGTSFFGLVFPDEHVTLGWSSIAVHWLSRLPCAVPDHISSACAASGLRAQFAEQAGLDWKCFLDQRARELCPGGRLVVLAGSADAQGIYGGEPLYELANSILQQLVGEGLLREHEYRAMTVPTYHRTLEEFADPITNGPLRDRLVLEDQSQETMPDPLWEQFGAAGDVEAFAELQTAWFRAWSAPSLFRHLADDRTPESRQEVTEDFYRRMRLGIVAKPAAARCAWKLAVLLIAKPSR
jgi:hypothetical protein